MTARPMSRTLARLALAAGCTMPLAACISVRPPDKPIEINLNVKIEQQVLVRLQRDVDQLIKQNPDVFPGSTEGSTGIKK